MSRHGFLRTVILVVFSAIINGKGIVLAIFLMVKPLPLHVYDARFYQFDACLSGCRNYS